MPYPAVIGILTLLLVILVWVRVNVNDPWIIQFVIKINRPAKKSDSSLLLSTISRGVRPTLPIIPLTAGNCITEIFAKGGVSLNLVLTYLFSIPSFSNIPHKIFKLFRGNPDCVSFTFSSRNSSTLYL